MKTTIYYFTSTGNSLKIARDLVKELGDETEIVFIPDVIEKEEIKTNSDKVGIVYPVYMFGEPLIVSDFIKKLILKKNTYIFVIVNYAGMAGGALYQTQEELKFSGLKLSAGFGLVMPSNYTPLGGGLSLDKQKGIFSKEEEKIKEIAGIVKEEKEVPLKGFFLFIWIARFIYKIFSPKIPSSDKEFWLSEGCTSCGICEKVCPADNIILESGRPKWMGKCQSCVACLQWCPKEAIQFGKFTKGRKRYHHPEVTVNDIMRRSKI